jgi:hypothetical protein
MLLTKFFIVRKPLCYIILNYYLKSLRQIRLILEECNSGIKLLFCESFSSDV